MLSWALGGHILLGALGGGSHFVMGMLGRMLVRPLWGGVCVCGGILLWVFGATFCWVCFGHWEAHFVEGVRGHILLRPLGGNMVLGPSGPTFC